MPSNKELRVWLLLGVGLLGGMLGWILYDHLRWPTGGTPEEVVRHLQHHTRLMRYFIIVFAGVVLSGMTRWVYWALCRALAPAKHEVYALQPRDAQDLRDFCTRRKPSTTWTTTGTPNGLYGCSGPEEATRRQGSLETSET
jgi:hypothetical protein